MKVLAATYFLIFWHLGIVLSAAERYYRNMEFLSRTINDGNTEVILGLIQNCPQPERLKLKCIDLAIVSGNVELAQFLLELDGYLYLNAKESGGNTFLHRACMAEKANSVEALLSWGGIDVNAQNNTGKTCIYSCLDDSDSNEFGCFRLLLQDERMNVNSVDNEGESVLHYAVDQELIEFVKELIEDGKIDLDIQDNIGGTALHHAVGKNLIEIAALLIEAGASFSIPDNDGITSKDLATMSDYQEIIELFNVAERFRPSILK